MNSGQTAPEGGQASNFFLGVKLGLTHPVGQVVLIIRSSLIKLHPSLIKCFKGGENIQLLVYCKFEVN